MGVRMRRDRHARLPVCFGHGAQYPLHAGRHTRLVGAAFQDTGFRVRARNAFADVLDEHVHHDFPAFECRARAAEVKEERDIVVGVDPGGDYDVQFRPGRHALDARNITSKAHHGEIHDGLHAARMQLIHAHDSVLDALFFVAPGLRIILHDLGGQHEDVLVHQRDAELPGIDRSANCLYSAHISALCQLYSTRVPVMWICWRANANLCHCAINHS